MKVSIIIPVHNGSSTIIDTLKSLLRQKTDFVELLIFDDGSRDDSYRKVSEFLQLKKVKNSRLIKHQKSIGLAATYNEGIKLAKSELVVTAHQDIILMPNALAKLTQPFDQTGTGIVVSAHVVQHPKEVWSKYNFWQRVFFSRLVEKKFSGVDGKFDCFRKSALLQVGLFDQKNFRTAGEDGDMVCKLKKIGKIVPTDAEIIHIHQSNGKFGLRDLCKKQAQYSEAQGVLLRLGRVQGIKQPVLMFFREMLLLALLIPYVRFVAIIAVVIYSFIYTAKAFTDSWNDPRIIILPFINIFLLFVSLIYSIRGLIYGKQKI